MKKLLFGLYAFTLVVCFTSCEKETPESPGNIQGMGNTPGKLKIKEPFVLPEGINIVGEITGLDNSAGSKYGLNQDSKYSILGSGDGVKLVLTFINSTDVNKTVFLPKGLLFESNSIDNCNALVLQTTWFCITSNSQRTIVLNLYCITKTRTSPGPNSTYKAIGISSSDVIDKFLKMIKWRRINIEMNYGGFNGVKTTSSQGPTYELIIDRLQTIVTNLTSDGIDISVDDKSFIESIPELSSEEIPPLINQSQFPVYFNEFIMLLK
jgi:hypothetical protein